MWNVECYRTFAKRVDKETEEEFPMQLVIRKLHIYGNWIWTNYLLVNYIVRKGEERFCVHYMPNKEKSPWDFFNKKPVKMKRDGSYSRQEFLAYLSRFIGKEAEAAISALLTAIPEKKVG
jgi:hypothetical protein